MVTPQLARGLEASSEKAAGRDAAGPATAGSHVRFRCDSRHSVPSTVLLHQNDDRRHRAPVWRHRTKGDSRSSIGISGLYVRLFLAGAGVPLRVQSGCLVLPADRNDERRIAQ